MVMFVGLSLSLSLSIAAIYLPQVQDYHGGLCESCDVGDCDDGVCNDGYAR